MKITEKELIDGLKENIIFERHMYNAASGHPEDPKYDEIVEGQGYDPEYYLGRLDALSMILLMVIGGQKMYEFQEELWNTPEYRLDQN